MQHSSDSFHTSAFFSSNDDSLDFMGGMSASSHSNFFASALGSTPPQTATSSSILSTSSTDEQMQSLAFASSDDNINFSMSDFPYSSDSLSSNVVNVTNSPPVAANLGAMMTDSSCMMPTTPAVAPAVPVVPATQLASLTSSARSSTLPTSREFDAISPESSDQDSPHSHSNSSDSEDRATPNPASPRQQRGFTFKAEPSATPMLQMQTLSLGPPFNPFTMPVATSSSSAATTSSASSSSSSLSRALAKKQRSARSRTSNASSAAANATASSAPASARSRKRKLSVSRTTGSRARNTAQRTTKDESAPSSALTSPHAATPDLLNALTSPTDAKSTSSLSLSLPLLPLSISAFPKIASNNAALVLPSSTASTMPLASSNTNSSSSSSSSEFSLPLPSLTDPTFAVPLLQQQAATSIQVAAAAAAAVAAQRLTSETPAPLMSEPLPLQIQAAKNAKAVKAEARAQAQLQSQLVDVITQAQVTGVPVDSQLIQPVVQRWQQEDEAKKMKLARKAYLARSSRQRKKAHMVELEQQVNELKGELDMLRAQYKETQAELEATRRQQVQKSASTSSATSASSSSLSSASMQATPSELPAALESVYRNFSEMMRRQQEALRSTFDRFRSALPEGMNFEKFWSWAGQFGPHLFTSSTAAASSSS